MRLRPKHIDNFLIYSMNFQKFDYYLAHSLLVIYYTHMKIFYGITTLSVYKFKQAKCKKFQN